MPVFFFCTYHRFLLDFNEKANLPSPKAHNNRIKEKLRTTKEAPYHLFPIINLLQRYIWLYFEITYNYTLYSGNFVYSCIIYILHTSSLLIATHH